MLSKKIANTLRKTMIFIGLAADLWTRFALAAYVAALVFLGPNSLMTAPTEKIKCTQNPNTGAFTGCTDTQIKAKTGIDPSQRGNQTPTTTKAK